MGLAGEVRGSRIPATHLPLAGAHAGKTDAAALRAALSRSERDHAAAPDAESRCTSVSGGRPMKSILRWLRGTLGNALLWAGAWFLAAFPLTALAPIIFKTTPGFTYLGAWLFLAPTLAIMGFVSGGAFSLYLGTAGRNQRLHELSSGRVALGTGITVGVLMAVFLVLLVTLRGFPVAWLPMILASSITGAIGGVTALGQVKIAQKGLTAGEQGRDELASGEERLLPELEGEYVGRRSPGDGDV